MCQETKGRKKHISVRQNKKIKGEKKMENAIVEKKENKSLSILEDKNVAQAFFDSGIFKNVKNAAQALVKIIAGREQGLAPIQSMSSVFIYNDQICYLTKVFLAKIKKTKSYDYRVKESNDKVCTIEFYKDKQLIGTTTYTYQEAIKAGLVNKDNWRKYPTLMLYYRAGSNGIKMFMPEILDGANIYEDFDEIEENTTKNKTINVDLSTGEIEEDLTKEEKAIEVEQQPTEEESAQNIF